MDTMNEFAIGISGEHVRLLVPPPRELTKDRALLFAAWIVAVADPFGEKFAKVLEAVRNT